MGSYGLIQQLPLRDEYDDLGGSVEDLTVQELVPQLAIEALVVVALLRTARIDVGCIDTDTGQPPSHELRRELRPVVRTTSVCSAASSLRTFCTRRCVVRAWPSTQHACRSLTPTH